MRIRSLSIGSKILILGVMGAIGAGSMVVPAEAAAQLGIDEVCTAVMTACVAPTTRAALRRGMTEKITIRGPFVDQTSKAQVISGAPADVHVTAVSGYPCSNVGCLEITVTIDPDFNLSSRNVNFIVTNLFGTKSFGTFIVRKGEVTGMTQSPDPAAWGETVHVTVSGNDIGNTRAAVPHHTVSGMNAASGSPGAGTASFNVVAGGSQTGTSLGIVLGDNSISGIPGQYRFTSSRRTVNYRPASQVASCVTTPAISAPTLFAPQNNQVFTFTTNPLQAVITVRWGGGQGQFKSNEKWVIELGPVNQTPTSVTTNEGVLQRSYTLNRNTTYRWRVRAWNCDAPLGPFSAFSQFVVQ